MTGLNLPEPIAAYFQADTQNAEAVARCFTNDGAVLDEGKQHAGPAAIQEWKAASDAKYTAVATPRTIEKTGRGYTVISHVSGNFPGSPVDLRYAFTLERGKIATLEITL